MSRSWELFLRDILEASERIARYTKGMDQTTFGSNELVYDAVIRNLEIIGEASKGIPDVVRAQHPDLDWKGMARLRDVLAHAYFSVNDTIVWDVVSNEVPLVIAQVRRILNPAS